MFASIYFDYIVCNKVYTNRTQTSINNKLISFRVAKIINSITKFNSSDTPLAAQLHDIVHDFFFFDTHIRIWISRLIYFIEFLFRIDVLINDLYVVTYSAVVFVKHELPLLMSSVDSLFDATACSVVACYQLSTLHNHNLLTYNNQHYMAPSCLFNTSRSATAAVYFNHDCCQCKNHHWVDLNS